jgi:hypothetical protein
MLRAMAVLALTACAHTLAPNESECTTGPGPFGTSSTRCKHGVAQGWWCTIRDDGLGLCMRQPGQCEVFRTREGGASDYGKCGFQDTAICAGDQCFTSLDVCGDWERRMGRDGGACVMAR